MKPVRTWPMDDDPDGLRAQIRTQWKPGRHHPHTPAQPGCEPDRWDLAATEIREAVLACRVLLFELATYLDILDRIKEQDLRDTILTRARQDVGRLTQSLSRIVACTEKERSPP